jgi:glycosyltransferase involved in cell wall biosynthesis
MQLNLERRATQEKILNRWLFQEELRRIKNYETQKVVNSCEYMTVVAQKDKTLIPSHKIEVIPNGVDINIFKPQKQNILRPTIIFSGNMSYAPNIHALNWFVKNCLPLIQTKIENVTLIIAGANPTKEIRNLTKQKGIVVTGFVDSMVDILNQANVAIAPMQSGSGMQNKILEAMATELPIVTTTLGLGSIQAQPEQEILVTDNPKQFAQYIVELLNNPQWAKEIGKKARQFVISNHSWEYTLNQIEEIYSKIMFSTLR